jgi:hypothetical protein
MKVYYIPYRTALSMVKDHLQLINGQQAKTTYAYRGVIRL